MNQFAIALTKVDEWARSNSFDNFKNKVKVRMV